MNVLIFTVTLGVGVFMLSGCHGGVVRQASGCVYKGVVHTHGETWRDACDYDCTCDDGSTGHYTCQSLCVNFNLPAACHYEAAPAGMCCPTPVCPAGYVIQYPDGYVPQR